jgi:hypothetical protein
VDRKVSVLIYNVERKTRRVLGYKQITIGKGEMIVKKIL